MNRHLLLVLKDLQRTRKTLIGYQLFGNNAVNPFPDQPDGKTKIEPGWSKHKALIGSSNSDALNPLTETDAVNP